MLQHGDNSGLKFVGDGSGSLDDDRDSLKYLGCDRRSLHSRRSLETHGVRVHTSTTVTGISRQSSAALDVHATGPGGPLTRTVDLVLVVVGSARTPRWAAAAGARLGAHGAIAVDEEMRLPCPGSSPPVTASPLTTGCSDCGYLLGLDRAPPVGDVATQPVE